MVMAAAVVMVVMVVGQMRLGLPVAHLMGQMAVMVDVEAMAALVATVVKVVVVPLPATGGQGCKSTSAMWF